MTEKQFRHRYRNVLARWRIGYIDTPWGFHGSSGFSHKYVKSVIFGSLSNRRTDGPSQLIFYGNGSIQQEHWTLPDGRPHRENGPADIAYHINGKINYCSYYIRGVDVPRNVVLEPEQQSIKTILHESNIERQRIRIERYGWIKFLQTVEAKPIDVAENPVENTIESLFQYRLIGIDRRGLGGTLDCKILVCSCPSTARVYALQVPRRFVKCTAVRKWLMGGRMRKLDLIGAS